MEKLKYTEGPWVAARDGEVVSVFGNYDADAGDDGRAVIYRTRVCDLSGDTGDVEEAANGHLIEAAPEMYEALAEVEWAGEMGACPQCDKLREEGHTEQCVVGIALGRARGARWRVYEVPEL